MHSGRMWKAVILVCAVQHFTCTKGLARMYEEVTLTEIGGDSNSRGFDHALPESLTLSLQRSGKRDTTTFHLTENKLLNQNAPMFDVQTVNGKQKVVRKDSLPLVDVKFYQDQRNGGSFKAECLNNQLGYCRRTLHGTFELNNDMYEIMPFPEVTSQRSLPWKKDDVAHVIVKLDKESLNAGDDLTDLPQTTVQGNDAALLASLRRQLIDKLSDLKRGQADTSARVDSSRRKAGSDLVDKLRGLLTSSETRNEEELGKNYRFDDGQLPPKPDIEQDERNLRDNVIRELKEMLALEKLSEEKPRQKRTTVKYMVEVLVAMDHTVWEKYTTPAGNGMTQEQATEYALRKHFSLIMNGVSLRYRSISDPDMSIDVFISGFIYTREHTASCPSYGLTVSTDKGVQYVSSSAYLDGLRQWLINVENAATSPLPDNDHVMVFTDYDLYGYYFHPGDYGNAGKAWRSAVCTPYRVSVLEDDSYFVATSTAAHELGHNLGARHDPVTGDSDCLASHEYIMAPATAIFDKTKTYKVHPWRFSKCSVNDFKTKMDQLGSSNCMLDTGTLYNGDEYKSHNKQLPGEMYSLDQQCKLAYGSSSYYCGGDAVKVTDRLCINMACHQPVLNGCYLFIAAQGTPCGPPQQNKWCIDGDCVVKTTGTTDDKTDAPTHTAAPTVATTSSTSGGGNSAGQCTDSGVRGQSCSFVNRQFGYQTYKWCPLYADECCAMCTANCEKGRGGSTCAELRNMNSHMSDVRFCGMFAKECCVTCKMKK